MAPSADFCAAAGRLWAPSLLPPPELTDDGHHDEHGGGAQDGEQGAQAPAPQRRRGVGLLGFDASGARGLATLLLGGLGFGAHALSGYRQDAEASARHPWWRTARQAGVSSGTAGRAGRRPPGGITESGGHPDQRREGGDPAHVTAETATEPKSCGSRAEILRRVSGGAIEAPAPPPRERRSTSNQTRQPLVLSTPQRAASLASSLQAVAVGLDVLGVEARPGSATSTRAKSSLRRAKKTIRWSVAQRGVADRVADDLGRQQGHRVLDVLVEAVRVKRATGEPRRLRAGLEGEEHLAGSVAVGHPGRGCPVRRPHLTPARTDVRSAHASAVMAAILTRVRAARALAFCIASPAPPRGLRVQPRCTRSPRGGSGRRTSRRPSPTRATRRRPTARRRPDAAPAQASQTARRAAAPRPTPRSARARAGLRTRAGRAIDAAGLTTRRPRHASRRRRRSRVAAIINAANSVARKPYVYGGGHGRLADETFVDTAYDCSGSVSFALAAAGLVDSPMDSSALARFGRPGPGRWVTIYANARPRVHDRRRACASTRRAATRGGSRWQADGRGRWRASPSATRPGL